MCTVFRCGAGKAVRGECWEPRRGEDQDSEGGFFFADAKPVGVAGRALKIWALFPAWSLICCGFKKVPSPFWPQLCFMYCEWLGWISPVKPFAPVLMDWCWLARPCRLELCDEKGSEAVSGLSKKTGHGWEVRWWPRNCTGADHGLEGSAGSGSAWLWDDRARETR